MKNLLEEFTAEINRHFFLREFSFDRNKFKSACGQEYELADHVIAMPAGTLVFQLKEREANAPADESSMTSWFRRKVLDKACRQLADTVRFLRAEPSLLVLNQRGHTHDLAGCTENIIQVILFRAHSPLPAEIRGQRHYVSKRAGFVHTMDIQDYYQLCHTLALPRELMQYFEFRQELLLARPDLNWPEPILAAQFIMDTGDRLPDHTAMEVLGRTRIDNASVDLSPILTQFGGKIVHSSSPDNPHQYYQLLAELTKLDRAEMRELKRLIDWALVNAGGKDIQIPARLLCPSARIGFVVFPVHAGAYHLRMNALMNFSAAMKYESHLERQVGISVAKEADMIDIDWMLIEAPWEQDPDMEAHLERSYPFRGMPEPRRVFRYNLSQDAQVPD